MWKKPDKLQKILLGAVIAAAFFGVLFSVHLKERVPAYEYDMQVQAAQQMEKCMEAVKVYKQQLGIPLSDEDHFKTGMLGEDFNFITTTIGAPDAKRTSANSDLAALLVRLLKKAGVSSGDTVGCNFSGSFPAINLAVICACDTMRVTPVYIASCGASTFGANNPKLSFPEMTDRLFRDGLISCEPALVTPGGGDDVGASMDAAMLEEIWSRVSQLGIPMMKQADFEENVESRMALLDKRDIRCFVTVGGNITSMGENGAVLSMGQGLLSAQKTAVTKGSGLIERYLSQGTPVILMLNIRKLMADYGLPFDPDQLPAIGTSAVYYRDFYPVWSIVVPLAIILGLLILYGRHEKQKRTVL